MSPGGLSLGGEGAGDLASSILSSRSGDRAARASLSETIYTEIHAIAAAALRREARGHTLGATDITNGVLARLLKGRHLDVEDRTHFFGLFATTMRNYLVDHARHKKAQKRGGGEKNIPLSQAAGELIIDKVDETLAVNDAVEALAAVDPRAARVVELRYFVGLTVAEVAEALGVSVRTVADDWSIGRSWLHGELSADRAMGRQDDAADP